MTTRAVVELEQAVTRIVPSISERSDDELQRMVDACYALWPHVVFERVYRGYAQP